MNAAGAGYIYCSMNKKKGNGIYQWRHVNAGTPLSAMDGILVAVKDEIDCLPYPTTVSVVITLCIVIF
uniref:Amidase domain-containing protein n=1 Tax=Oryza meridionalis TaxID=40149 RepID=A0A0E0F9W8_9ORYZ